MSAPQFTPGPWDIDGISLVHAADESRGGQRVTVAKAVHNPQANARLIAASPNYHTACGGALHPGEADSCGPLAWLRSAIDTLKEDAVRAAAEGDDQDAYWTMVNECEELHRGLSAALAKARGEQ